jgi:hypothetical protein
MTHLVNYEAKGRMECQHASFDSEALDTVLTPSFVEDQGGTRWHFTLVSRTEQKGGHIFGA